MIGEEGDVLLSRRNVGDPATFLELLAEIDGECRIALRSRAGSRRSLSLAFTGAASAQTAFQANTTSTGTLSAGPGSNGAVVCGTAKIAHFGAASWDLFSAGSPVIDPQNPFCAIYPQTADFTLLRDQKSTLTLDENDTVCGPGLNGAGYFSEGPMAYGHPNYASGIWNVDAATGQFSGLTGSGTDALLAAGAHTAGSHTGGTFG